MERYLREVSAGRRTERADRQRLTFFAREFPALADKALLDITAADLAAWRDERMQKVAPATVQRELNTLRPIWSIGVNRVGDDPDEVHYSGHSQVISPKGKVISMADIDTEAVVSFVLDYEKLLSFREKFPVGKDWDSFTINH